MRTQQALCLRRENLSGRRTGIHALGCHSGATYTQSCAHCTRTNTPLEAHGTKRRGCCPLPDLQAFSLGNDMEVSLLVRPLRVPPSFSHHRVFLRDCRALSATPPQIQGPKPPPAPARRPSSCRRSFACRGASQLPGVSREPRVLLGRRHLSAGAAALRSLSCGPALQRRSEWPTAARAPGQTRQPRCSRCTFLSWLVPGTCLRVFTCERDPVLLDRREPVWPYYVTAWGRGKSGRAGRVCLGRTFKNKYD